LNHEHLSITLNACSRCKTLFAAIMVEELDFHGYICALCENRINLDSECCCQNSEDALFEVTDERLLKVKSSCLAIALLCVEHNQAVYSQKLWKD